MVLGVAFFLAVSALMRGSERDLIARLVDTTPHITVYGEVPRGAATTNAADGPGAVAIHGVKPKTGQATPG